MNYRHAFHAGNFADVLKHAVLSRIICHLRLKDKAFRVIDTHAGPGVCDLRADEATRTGEWRQGIARLRAAVLPAEAAALLDPYLSVIRTENLGGLRRYPGSPLLARRLLRPQDRLTAVELHPADSAALKALFAGDHQARVIRLDGWFALGAQVPPKERRGMVLVDPPFEDAADWKRLLSGLAAAHRRWPGGIYALWYPVKEPSAADRFRESLARSGIPKILDAAVTAGLPASASGLAGSGLAVVNPPFPLEAELRIILPALRDALAQGPSAAFRLEWLAGEPRADAEASSGA